MIWLIHVEIDDLTLLARSFTRSLDNWLASHLDCKRIVSELVCGETIYTNGRTFFIHVYFR